jgi:hypothetical protein
MFPVMLLSPVADSSDSFLLLLLHFPFRKECCKQNRLNKKELVVELIEEAEIIPTLEGEGNTTTRRLFRDDHEQEERHLRGRELKVSLDCARACKLKPNGYWCLYVCNADDSSDDRRLDSGDIAGDSVYVPTCVEYPDQVENMLNRMIEKGVTFKDCELEVDCLILRECT